MTKSNGAERDLLDVSAIGCHMLERLRMVASLAANHSVAILSTLLAMLCCFAGSSKAEVATATPTGFLVKREFAVAVPSTTVFSTLTEFGRWWNPDHTFSGDAHNLSIELKGGGCFCERLANGGSVRHLEVVYYEPGHVLRMTGAMGPLQANGLSGSLTLAVRETAPGSSVVAMSYSVGGFMVDGVDKMAVPVDLMLGEQLTRLKSLLETGDPARAKAITTPAN